MSISVPPCPPWLLVLRREQVRTVARFCRILRDRPALGNALAGRQLLTVLDVIHQEIERFLGVRLDHLDFSWEQQAEALDVVSVLDFIEPVGWMVMPVVIVIAIAIVVVLA